VTLQCKPTSLPEVFVFQPDVFPDSRGFFMETYNQKKYQEAGVPGPFVQDNHSHSTKGVLRGLHYQLMHPQGKLVFVLRGAILDVAVDIRQGGPTFGQWVAVELNDENKKQLYIPEGFAHGFCVLSDEVDVMYKCTDLYTPGDDYGVLWSDPDIGIDWPVETPLISEKDAANPTLRDALVAELPVYSRMKKKRES
jgi:dTDP-4-dehydrorhamnose 3,5-epimerase